MFYVYILKSISFPEQIYVGYTGNLNQRLKTHNNGMVIHTSKYLPWEVITYTAFHDQQKAVAFEKYLKTSSGKMLLRRFLLNQNMLRKAGTYVAGGIVVGLTATVIAKSNLS